MQNDPIRLFRSHTHTQRERERERERGGAQNHTQGHFICNGNQSNFDPLDQNNTQTLNQAELLGNITSQWFMVDMLDYLPLKIATEHGN